MKPQALENRDIRSSGIVASQKMRIADGQERIVFNVLRKTMYSDKPSSIFREYIANALDEHVRLDKVDVPFEVTFPNALSPTLKIRDFGRGLSEEQVFHFFGQFGASDKRETNDLIGAFGLGCKVAHAYTDSYTVTSVLNGVKRIFNCYIGQDECGDISKFGDDVPTDEPNGVEIAIAIEPHHIKEFVDKGLKIIKYLPTIPVIKGLSYEPKFDENKLVTSGTGWRYYTGHYGSKAVCLMGYIAYEINKHAMGGLNSVESLLLDSNLQLDVAIGEVDVTSSREALEMTDRTRAAIKTRLKVVLDEMVAQAEKDFANAKTEFEARKLYWNTIGNGGGYGTVLRQNLDGIKWNGKKIDSNVIKFDESVGKHKIVTYQKYYARRRNSREKIEAMSESRLVCTSDIEDNLYFDDTTDGKVINYKRRAKTLFDADLTLQNVWLLQSTDVAEFEQLTGLKVKDLRSYAAVTPTYVKVARGGTGIDIKKRAKHQTQVFELDLAQLKSHSSAASDNWKVLNLDLDDATGVYVNIDRFQPTKAVVDSIRELRNVMRALELLGVAVDVPIYGMKPSVTDFGKLKHFDVWLKEKVESIPNLKEDYALGLEYNYYNFELEIAKEKLVGKAKEYVELYKRIDELHHTGNMTEKKLLLSKTSIVVSQSNKLEKLKQELDAEFPLLKYLDSSHHDNPEVIEYLTPKTT